MNQNQLLKSVTDLQVQKFLSDEIAICQAHRVKIKVEDSVTVANGGSDCHGWFQDRPALLVIAVGKPVEDWLPTFVHESCHRDQWIEQDPTWTNLIKNYFDANLILDMWVYKAVELTPRQLTKVVKSIINNELDCEKRSLAKIQKFNLPINQIEYIQKANAYIFYYLAIAATRQYATKNAAYENPKIWKKMPVDFAKRYSKISSKLLKLYLKHSW